MRNPSQATPPGTFAPRPSPARPVRPAHPVRLPLLLPWLLAAAGCSGEAPVKSVTINAPRNGDDAGTGWDFALDQTDIPPEADPLLRNPDRYLPQPRDAGVLSLLDAAVLDAPFDGGIPLGDLPRDDASSLCALALAHADMRVTPTDFGDAVCVYELAQLRGFDAAAVCDETLGALGGCMLELPLLCGSLTGCSATVSTFVDCARELSEQRAAFATLYGDCALFDGDAAQAPDVPALAGRALFCESLERDCPGTLVSP